MNALTHDFDLSRADSLDTHGPLASRVHASWDALHEAADAVARLAQLGRERPNADIDTLPQRAIACGGARKDAVEQGIDDLSAVMQVGLRALLDSTGRDRDCTAAAVMLWREFHAGREAILAFAAPAGPAH